MYALLVFALLPIWVLGADNYHHFDTDKSAARHRRTIWSGGNTQQQSSLQISDKHNHHIHVSKDTHACHKNYSEAGKKETLEHGKEEFTTPHEMNQFTISSDDIGNNTQTSNQTDGTKGGSSNGEHHNNYKSTERETSTEDPALGEFPTHPIESGLNHVESGQHEIQVGSGTYISSLRSRKHGKYSFHGSETRKK